MNTLSNYSALAHHFQKVESLYHPSITPINHLYLFSNSPYIIHILSANTSDTIYSISSEEPINCFMGLQIPDTNDQSFLVVVNTCGSVEGNRWIIYHLCRNKRSMGYEVRNETMGVNSSPAKLVNVHYLGLQNEGRDENSKLLWIFENGQIEYCRLPRTKQAKPICTVQYRKESTKKSREYSGRKFLKQLATEHKITKSIFNHANNTLALLILNNSSQDISSLYQFIINPQEYQILAGPDNLLSLNSVPLAIQIIKQKKDKFACLIFEREHVKLWSSKGLTATKIPPLISLVTKLDNHTYLFISASSLYLLSLEYDQNVKITQLQEKIQSDSILAIKDAPLAKNYYLITNRLQTIKIHNNTPTIIISNSSSLILSAELLFGPFHNYLTFKKKTGFNKQHVLLSHNQVVTQKDEYQHNMLLKMVELLGSSTDKNQGSVWLSSPIIGTLQLNVRMNKENEFIIESNKGGEKIRTNMESLFLSGNGSQITSTDLLYKDKIYQIESLFEGKIDYTIGGCICGYFGVLGVQKQVHVFSLQSNIPKRVAIHVFDDDVKKIINLNDVNFIGVVLWDLSFTILCITQNSVKPIQNQQTQKWLIQPNIQYVHSSQLIINTQKFICTLLAGYMILCSSDTLHLYQPQKTIVHFFELPSHIFGRQCFPVLDLNGETQNKMVLVKVEDKKREQENSYRLVRIGGKYLVKDLKDIKLQVEEIIGYPEQSSQELLFVAVKDSNYLIVCSNRIITLTTQTGKIKIDQTKYLSSFLNKFKHSRLAMQVKSEEEQSKTIIFDNLVSLSNHRFLVWNEQQLWLTQPTPSKYKGITVAKPISYFSMPNDAFLEFRNNLSIEELEDPQFMAIFAKKQPIKTVAKITGTKFAVLFENSIVIVEVGVSEMLVIQQQISFKNSMQVGEENDQYVKITNFIGFYDIHSLYLKDGINHRLFVLKQNMGQGKYEIVFLKDLELDQEFVCIHRVQEWKKGSRKMSVSGISQMKQQEFEELIIKKDGQMTVDKSLKPIYL